MIMSFAPVSHWAFLLCVYEIFAMVNLQLQSADSRHHTTGAHTAQGNCSCHRQASDPGEADLCNLTPFQTNIIDGDTTSISIWKSLDSKMVCILACWRIIFSFRHLYFLRFFLFQISLWRCLLVNEFLNVGCFGGSKLGGGLVKNHKTPHRLH